MSGYPSLSITPGQRNHGVIVTAVHEDGPPLLSFHTPGKLEEAVIAACDRIDALGVGWKIRTMSTPRSIYRDLQGHRDERKPLGRDGTDRGEEYDLRETERRLLRDARRLDLLEPLRFTTPVRADAVMVAARVEHLRDGTRIGGNT